MGTLCNLGSVHNVLDTKELCVPLKVADTFRAQRDDLLFY